MPLSSLHRFFSGFCHPSQRHPLLSHPVVATVVALIPNIGDEVVRQN
jgi:hypothetical protein